MTRSLHKNDRWSWRSSALLLALLALVPGCTFSDGEPWGTVAFSLKLSFDASDRVVEGAGGAGEVRWRVGDGYVVTLEPLEADIGALRLLMAPAGVAATFDEANPPEGYSLCHNGHCHAADGRLVDYEDIALELANSTSGGSSVAQPVDATSTVTAPRSVVTVAMPDCPNGCRLERGSLLSVELSAATWRVQGRVFDEDPTRGRLPAEGLSFDTTVTSVSPWAYTLTGEVSRDSAASITLDGNLSITPRLFDGINWAQLPADADAQNTALVPVLRENLARSEFQITYSAE